MGPWRVKFVEAEEFRRLVEEHVNPQPRYVTEVNAKLLAALDYVPWRITRMGDEIYGVVSVCPICGGEGYVNLRTKERPRWAWNGSMETPTLTPSCAQGPHTCPMHVWVRDGQIIDAGTPAH